MKNMHYISIMVPNTPMFREDLKELMAKSGVELDNVTVKVVEQKTHGFLVRVGSEDKEVLKSVVETASELFV